MILVGCWGMRCLWFCNCLIREFVVLVFIRYLAVVVGILVLLLD